jgi:tetratricopeptide (TPR) repeat protein
MQEPSNPGVYTGLGLSYYQLGDFASAVDYLNQAIALDPTNAVAYGNLGFAQYNLGEYHNAQANLETAIALNPSEISYHLALGQAHARQGHTDEAQAALAAGESLSHTPEQMQILGGVYIQMNRYEDAMRIYDMLLDNIPNSAVGLAGSGKASFFLGEFDVAEDRFHALLELGQYKDVAYQYLAIIATRQDKHELAVDYTRRLLEIDPDSIEALERYGWNLALTEQTSESRRYFDMALSKNPNSANAKHGKAYSYYLDGNCESAIVIADDIIQNHPHYFDMSEIRTIEAECTSS